MEGPQGSERVSRQNTSHNTETDTEADAPCVTLILARALLVMIWRAPRAQFPARKTRTLIFLGNTP